MMSPISILYAPRDEALGAKIAAALADAGHAATPMNTDYGGPGTGARSSGDGAAIVVWTHAAAKLAQLHRQAEEAMERGALIPVAVGGARPPGGFENLPPVDLSGWTGSSDDPRWRFVLEEIQLTTRRMGLEDADLWSSSEIEPDNDEPGLNGGEESQDLWRPGAEMLAPQSEAPISARKAEPMTAPPAFLHRQKPKRRFSAREVAIGATAGIVGMTVLTALLAPIVLPGPAPVSDAPSTALNDVPDPATDSPSSLAALSINPEDAPSDDIIIPTAPDISRQGDGAEEIAVTAEAITASPASLEAQAAETEANGAETDSSLEEDAMGSLIAALSAEEAGSETGDETAPQSASAETTSGDYFRDCANCPDMATIAAGSFKMGAPQSEVGAGAAERPMRDVSFSYGFALSAREITYAQWDACVADGGCVYKAPDHGWGRADRPVVSVSYDDARVYAAWLSEKTGEAYRLPTEAEWEYAARAGSSSPFSFGANVRASQANYNGEYPYSGEPETFRGRTTPAGSFAPNAFGLYDMHGNAWEWTADCWTQSHAGAPADGSAAMTGDCSKHVLKGGAWNTGGWRLRSAHRIGKSSGAREFDNGFRVARDL
ncbi:SUMF1/EgtB/PvdO family nonheme iron enzyme [Hyphococcus sp.]|uniref:SUMF1/EgtB/PvdO family nonheme iron enzyme n=1 Tax=Hyphococcus sp. TaxID=2038636 RepID=UPI0035C706D5